MKSKALGSPFVVFLWRWVLSSGAPTSEEEAPKVLRSGPAQPLFSITGKGTHAAGSRS